MFTKSMTWVFIASLLLVLLWRPWSTGLPIPLLGLAVCAVATVANQASRAGDYFARAGYAMASREVEL